MMKFKLLSKYIPLIVLFLVNACSPVRYIETETLEPAKISIPQKFESGVLLLKEPSFDSDNIDKEELTPRILEEVKYGLADVLKNSPRFNSNEIVVPEQEEVKKFLNKDTLQWLDMKKITDTFNVDLVIILNNFSLNSRLDDEYVTEHGELLYKLTFQINSTAHWNIHYPYQNLLIDEHKYSEKFVWESLDYDEDGAISRLPAYKKTFLETAYWTGFDYGKRILPTWKKTTRSYYIKGPESFRKANDMIDSSRWEEAIELWKQNLNHSDAEIVSRAAYNIAFAFEMMGEIELAQKWAEKSWDIKPKRRTRNYIKVLKERSKTVSRLKNQIN